MQDAAPKYSYTREEVRRLFDLTERQLRGWEAHNLIPASQSAFAFTDLIALRTLVELRRNRIPLKRIKSAVTAIRRTFEGADPLKQFKVLSEGRKIRVQVDGQQMDAVSGQLLFDFNSRELTRLLAFPKKTENPRVQREQAEQFFQRGLEIEQTGGPPAEAIAAYETATRLDPASAGAFVNLGTIYFNQRAWSKAEQCYKQALEVDADYPLAHFNLANLYDERGDRHRAMLHYRTAVQINPSYADAHYNLALLYQNIGQSMEAVRHWKVYLKLDPGSQWGGIARRELAKLTQSAVVHGRKHTAESPAP